MEDLCDHLLTGLDNDVVRLFLCLIPGTTAYVEYFLQRSDCRERIPEDICESGDL